MKLIQKYKQLMNKLEIRILENKVNKTSEKLGLALLANDDFDEIYSPEYSYELSKKIKTLTKKIENSKQQRR